MQVHEKTILLPALPVALTIGDNPLAVSLLVRKPPLSPPLLILHEQNPLRLQQSLSFFFFTSSFGTQAIWFQIVAAFSMSPLLLR